MAERCLWDDEAVMEVLAPPGGVYKWMHSTMSSKPFSENMKWIPQLCEKAEVSVFCLSIELVCTQTESSSEHRTHWQWCISVAGQPKIYRLCRSVWAVHQIRSQRVSFVSACVSAAHLLIILCQRRHSAPICTNTTVQYSSPSPSLTGLSYGLTSAHQLYLCIQILDSSALWVSSKPVSQGRLM